MDKRYRYKTAFIKSLNCYMSITSVTERKGVFFFTGIFTRDGIREQQVFPQAELTKFCL